MFCNKGVVEFKIGNELYRITEKNGSCCPVRGEELNFEVFEIKPDDGTSFVPFFGPFILPFATPTRSYGSLDCCEPCNDNCVDLTLHMQKPNQQYDRKHYSQFFMHA